MSLYAAELRRLFKRRITRVVLALVVLALAVIAGAVTLASERVGPQQRAAAEAEAQANYEEQVRFHQMMVAECEAAAARGEDVSQRYGPDCGRAWGPQRDQFEAQWYLPYEFSFRSEFEIYISVFAGILVLLAFLVGASFVGAEWHSGGMTNLLLWRPQRLRVLFTKLGALLTGLLGVALGLGALWTLVFWLIGRYDGRTGTMTSGFWQSIGLTGARGIGLYLLLGLVGFGLASLGRHTAMALGVAVGVAVVSEIGIRIMMAVLGVPMGERFVLSTYAVAWFIKSWTLYDYRSCEFSSSGVCEPAELVITWQHAALVFGVGAALVLGVATWAMRRRDVT